VKLALAVSPRACVASSTTAWLIGLNAFAGLSNLHVVQVLGIRGDYADQLARTLRQRGVVLQRGGRGV
jgi:hypothetical protein